MPCNDNALTTAMVNHSCHHMCLTSGLPWDPCESLGLNPDEPQCPKIGLSTSNQQILLQIRDNSSIINVHA